MEGVSVWGNSHVKLIIKVVNIAEVAMFLASKLFEMMPIVIVLAVKEFWKSKLDG